MATATPVKTTAVKGRRTVHYDSFDDLLADAEHMASIPTRTLGNWSVGQIYKHIGLALDAMIDGAPFGFPKPLQWLMRKLMLTKMTTQTLSPGFKLPKKAAALVPSSATPTEEGLSVLRKGVERVKSTSERAPHGGFGRISTEQWDAFQLRHCEMHMSFIVPETE